MKSIAFAVVISFATGFAIGVTVYDVQAKTSQCERAAENAERYAKAIAAVFNGETIETKEHTAKCRVRTKETS